VAPAALVLLGHRVGVQGSRIDLRSRGIHRSIGHGCVLFHTTVSHRHADTDAIHTLARGTIAAAAWGAIGHTLHKLAMELTHGGALPNSRTGFGRCICISAALVVEGGACDQPARGIARNHCATLACSAAAGAQVALFLRTGVDTASVPITHTTTYAGTPALLVGVFARLDRYAGPKLVAPLTHTIAPSRAAHAVGTEA